MTVFSQRNNELPVNSDVSAPIDNYKESGQLNSKKGEIMNSINFTFVFIMAHELSRFFNLVYTTKAKDPIVNALWSSRGFGI